MRELRFSPVLNLLLGGCLAAAPLGAQFGLVAVHAAEKVASDSTFPWRECEDPGNLTGYIRPSGGTVAYRLGRNGRPDTATVRVLATERISVAGYRHAIKRFLGGCRMQVPRGFPREGRDVRQVVRFGGNGVLPDAARPLDSLPPGLEDAPVLLPTQGLPLAHDDSRLEERASVIHPCSPSPARPPSGFYGSREEANRAFDQWAATQNGRVKLTVEVDTEGKPVPATVQVLENDSPSATNALVAGILRCRFTPARIGGRPIPAMAVVSQGQTVMRQGEGP